VKSSFEKFIETNSMMQSEFNLGFWFVSYNIFLLEKKWGLPLSPPPLSSLSRCLMHALPLSLRPLKDVCYGGKYSRWSVFAVMFTGPGAACFYAICSSIPLLDAYSVRSAVGLVTKPDYGPPDRPVHQ
jgi:hypothetical protein